MDWNSLNEFVKVLYKFDRVVSEELTFDSMRPNSDPKSSDEHNVSGECKSGNTKVTNISNGFLNSSIIIRGYFSTVQILMRYYWII